MSSARSRILLPSTAPVISTGIYASGDALGGILTFPGATNPSSPGAILHAITIADYDKQNVAIDILLYSFAVPTGTDNAAYTPVWANLRDYRIGVISVAIADYVSFAARSIATVPSLGLPLESLNPQGYIYAQMIVRGAPTYTTTSSISLALHVMREG